MEASENGTEEVQGIKKHRSPAYPSIDLEMALKRAQRLWDVAGKHAAPLSGAMTAWNYSARSSGGLQTVAALKQYGLANDEGTGWTRRIMLTKLAQELLVYGADKDSPEWKARSREAVLKPKIHAQLWQEYGGELPDDSMILPQLVLERGFSHEAAATMLKRFRASVAFARMTDEADTVSEDEPDGDSEQEHAGPNGGANQIMTPATIEDQQKPGSLESSGAERQQRTIQVTYSPTEWALVQAKFPLSESDWESMIGVLQAMKRGLVMSSDDDS